MLYRDFLRMPTVDLGPMSSLPTLCDAKLGPVRGPLTETEEDDGLYTDIGYVRSAFPYRFQDLYTREFTKDGVNCIVLENDHLKAVFVPEMGGKLWSLFDKDNNRELLFSNPVCRPAYLALRNAWTSGGVEWNLGWIGHHPHTCSTMYTTTLKMEDGTPVLRMYEYERVRKLVYQMDFFLPDDSKFLYCRMRITNPQDVMVPVYWWSNIAVDAVKGARLVTNADLTYTMIDNKLRRRQMPSYQEGMDVSYPETIKISADHFFRTRDGELKYETVINPDGYGLIQASTSRLKGRKLFVWGQGTGGRRWQKMLSGEGCDGRYYEIQAGLAYSQHENMPMPANTVWEWIEVYGAMQLDKDEMYSPWDEVQSIVSERMTQKGITIEGLEQLLIDTKPMAKRKAEELIYTGDGWGALENMRREKAGIDIMCPHLDFGMTGQEHEDWINLLENGTLGHHEPLAVPKSWMVQDEWVTMLENAVENQDKDNWFTYLQLGCAHLMQHDGYVDKAIEELEKSVSLSKSPWALYALGEVYRLTNNHQKAVEYMFEASKLLPKDLSLAKMTGMMLNRLEMYEDLYNFCNHILDESLKDEPRIRLYHAISAVKLGKLEEAENIFYRDEEFEIPDQKEGEVSVTDLWYDIEELRAKRDGREFDRNKLKCPEKYDYRMNTEE